MVEAVFNRYQQVLTNQLKCIDFQKLDKYYVEKIV